MTTSYTDLEESDTNEPIEFPPPERKIFTQPYDLSLATLKDQWDHDLLVIPKMQRQYLWDNARASRLIESFLLNIPVPPVYFAADPNSVLWIVDGHQRVKSVVRYLSNEFALTKLKILSEYRGLHFYQLPDREQRHLMTRSLRAVVIQADSHQTMKTEVFGRLNSGGIALNEQELRNSLYQGSLNDLLRELALHCEPFRVLIGTKQPRRRMVDEELILRWFAMHDRLKDYKPPLSRFLNDYMDDNKNGTATWLDSRKEKFTRTMATTYGVLGSNAFRLIDENGEQLRDAEGKPLPRGVNRALFDAQAIAFSWVVPGGEASNQEVVRAISVALQDQDLQDAVRRATGDRARIRLRIGRMVQALREAGLKVEVPGDTARTDVDEIT